MADEIPIRVGRVYRSKKPSIAGGMFVNDRMVVYVGVASGVQYDSPSVANGRHYPTVSLDRFRKWASHDVTEELPKGEWLDWPTFKKSLKKSPSAEETK